MPDANVKKITDIAAAEGVIIDIRPTTPHAAELLKSGKALPKPAQIKAKTINDLDVQLGLAPKEHLGKVGYFPPEKIQLPENFKDLDPEPPGQAARTRQGSHGGVLQEPKGHG